MKAKVSIFPIAFYNFSTKLCTICRFAVKKCVINYLYNKKMQGFLFKFGS